jgi:hypothetical protein
VRCAPAALLDRGLICEQERLDGRALLANFVANYGKVEEFKGIAGQITAFLNKARKVKPCPPA